MINNFNNPAAGFPAMPGFGNPEMLQPLDASLLGMPGGMGMHTSDMSQTMSNGPIVLSNPAGKALQVQIRKVYLAATKPQGDQFRRNYDIMMDGTTLDSITRAVDQKGGASAINAQLMSQILADPMTNAGGVVRYAGQPEAQVSIEHSWMEQRFRFVIMADVFRKGTHVRTEIVSGYTDHMGVVNGGMLARKLDPQMIFVINNITTIAPRRHYAGNQVSTTHAIQQSSAVLRNNGWRNSLSHHDTHLHTIRPQDVTSTTDKLTLLNGMLEDAEMTGVSYMDVDTTLAGVPKMSMQSSNMPATYAARTINSLIAAQLPDNDAAFSDSAQTSGQAAAMSVADEEYTSNAFVYAITNAAANGTNTTSMFSYFDLLQIDPTIDDRTVVATEAYEQNGILAVPAGTQVDTLGASTNLAVAATMIGNVTMALMSQIGASLMVFDAHNQFGKTDVAVTAFDGMDSDGLLWRRVEQLKQRLILEALSVVSAGDMLQYHVEVFADVFNDVYIKIRLDGDHGEFVVPAFASSLMSPVLTNDQGKLQSLATSAKQVADYCTSTFTHAGNASSFTPGHFSDF